MFVPCTLESVKLLHDLVVCSALTGAEASTLWSQNADVTALPDPGVVDATLSVTNLQLCTVSTAPYNTASNFKTCPCGVRTTDALANAAIQAAASATTVAAVAVTMGWDFPGMLWTLVTLSVLFHVVVWLFPVVSACVVQVVLTEVIRLSGAMADDDEGGDFGEAELGTGLGWEGVRRRVAMHHQQRSRQEGEEEGLQLQHEQNEQYQRGTKKMERRVTVEWESGQMFMVIRRPIVAEWVIDLVNRCI